MSNLLASLVSSAGALAAYGQVLEATQNNVANASTPGFAKQSINLYALPFPNSPCDSRPAGWDISSNWSTV